MIIKKEILLISVTYHFKMLSRTLKRNLKYLALSYQYLATFGRQEILNAASVSGAAAGAVEQKFVVAGRKLRAKSHNLF